MFLKAKHIDSFHTQVLSETFSETHTILCILKFHLNCISDSLKENIQCMIFLNSLHFCPRNIKCRTGNGDQVIWLPLLGDIPFTTKSAFFFFFFFFSLFDLKIFNSSSHCPPIHHNEQWAVLHYLWSFHRIIES